MPSGGISLGRNDLQVLKAMQPQRKIPLLAAHNSEVVGSSSTSATIKLPVFTTNIRIFLPLGDILMRIEVSSTLVLTQMLVKLGIICLGAQNFVDRITNHMI